MRKRRRTIKGGGFSETLTNLSNSISQGATTLSEKASNLWKQTKESFSSPSSSNYTSMGGKTRRRRMRGGFVDNTPLTGVAKNASSFSGPTAQPHNWVGGKTKKHRKKSRKHRKH